MPNLACPIPTTLLGYALREGGRVGDQMLLGRNRQSRDRAIACTLYDPLVSPDDPVMVDFEMHWAIDRVYCLP